MLNLDTHMLLHALTGDLTAAEQKTLASDDWAISAIVLWEVAKLAQLGRITFSVSDPELTEMFARITVLPITWDIARQSTQLDFKSDPADEIIAATSVVLGIPLATRDDRIRQSKLVRFAG